VGRDDEMTDRERLLELADAVVEAWSIGDYRKSHARVTRMVRLAAQALVDNEYEKAEKGQPSILDGRPNSSDITCEGLMKMELGDARPAEEVFEELDEESQGWENEGGQ